MAYDLEKYRDKREKVLGVRRRTISFGSLAILVSLIIVLGLGIVVIPQSIAYLQGRTLEDAIFKLPDSSIWPENVVSELQVLAGVRAVAQDNKGTRIVVTFDRNVLDVGALTAYFKQKDFNPVLLHEIGHSERVKILSEEKGK